MVRVTDLLTDLHKCHHDGMKGPLEAPGFPGRLETWPHEQTMDDPGGPLIWDLTSIVRKRMPWEHNGVPVVSRCLMQCPTGVWVPWCPTGPCGRPTPSGTGTRAGTAALGLQLGPDYQVLKGLVNVGGVGNSEEGIVKGWVNSEGAKTF